MNFISTRSNFGTLQSILIDRSSDRIIAIIAGRLINWQVALAFQGSESPVHGRGASAKTKKTSSNDIKPYEGHRAESSHDVNFKRSRH